GEAALTRRDGILRRVLWVERSHAVMTSIGTRDAARPPPDPLLNEIADYVLGFRADGEEARTIARYCLMDTLGCGMRARAFPACTRLLGPIVPGATLAGGARVPGTRHELD